MTAQFRGLFLIFLLLLAGCSTLPASEPRIVSHAFAPTESNGIGRAFLPPDHDRQSRFHLLVGGLDSLKARLALSEIAERSLDIQCYRWRMDQTGETLLQRVLLAADRGVRVRILLDDMHAMDEEMAWLAADAHPNIDVRFFNPIGNRGIPALDALLDGGRVNHRMHNKVMLFDGAVGIAGGRNIGDHYFGVNVESNFRDLDLLAAGQAVAELGRAFDEYWNGPWALPVTSLAGWRPRAKAADQLRDNLTQQLPEIDELPVSARPVRNDALAVAQDLATSMRVAKATVLVDSPDKVDNGEGAVMQAIESAIDDVEQELLIESAYFVPTDTQDAELGDMVDQGARVAVLTNSLATNDVVLAHAGYKNHQRPLLERGVELFELRPDATADRRRWSILANESLASLHTKAFVFDREKAFVGSLNFDPRSRRINTETGILVENRKLATQVAEVILGGMQAENSYRLLLDGEEVYWQSGEGDQAQRFDTDPETSVVKRAVTNALRVLPVESQL